MFFPDTSESQSKDNRYNHSISLKQAVFRKQSALAEKRYKTLWGRGFTIFGFRYPQVRRLLTVAKDSISESMHELSKFEKQHVFAENVDMLSWYRWCEERGCVTKSALQNSDMLSGVSAAYFKKLIPGQINWHLHRWDFCSKIWKVAAFA